MIQRKFYNPEDYENLLLDIDISSEEIFRQASLMRVYFIGTRNKTIEDQAFETPFIKAFYDYFLIVGNLPTQDEFFQYYLDTTHDRCLQWIKRDYSLLYGLKARVLRSYTSFIRDLHFCKLVQESFEKCEVMYNLELDFYDGVDLMISHENQHCGINLFTKTGRAGFFKTKKNNRHNKFLNVIPIDMPIDLSNVPKNTIGLYGMDHLESLDSALCNIFGVDSLY